MSATRDTHVCDVTFLQQAERFGSGGFFGGSGYLQQVRRWPNENRRNAYVTVQGCAEGGCVICF